MNIGFFVNDVHTERPAYTTTRLALTAVNRGHTVWLIGAGDFAYDADEKIRAWASGGNKKKYRSPQLYLADLQGDKARAERITVNDLDVLLLRNDPAAETGYRNWAQTTGIIFGRVAMRSGVLVLNDPNSLTGALDKMFTNLFPEEIRPRTIISRDRNEIKAFIQDVGGTAVLKNLQGTGGQAVFLATPTNRANLNQMIEAILRDGYVVAQEFLLAAATTSTRLFLLNGEPLRYKGKYAAFQWVRSEDEMQANIQMTGSTERAKLTDAHIRIAETMRPRLVEEGMFLVGLHIVADKLVDVNVFSPGGLGNAQTHEGVNFSEAVIMAVERKIEYMTYYQRNFANIDMATL